VDAASWQFYASGILNQCGTDLCHAVVIVGYDDDAKFWIMRNYWGSNWGEGGYIRIQKQSGKGTGLCGEAITAVYPK